MQLHINERLYNIHTHTVVISWEIMGERGPPEEMGLVLTD